MLRRLHHEQPESFAFAPANQAWAEAQMTKYPEGRPTIVARTGTRGMADPPCD